MPGAWFGLAVLFGMNLLNYMDRYVFFSVGKLIQEDLGVSDPGYGVLSVSFMIVYTVVSPLMGLLGDRFNRKRLLAFGVALWSVATVGTAFSDGFRQMFFWRALLGIGEATYGVIAPALLSDLFDPRRRGRVIGIYYLALPLGGGLGYVIGGWIGGVFGWRFSFWVVGLPGLFLALLGLLLHDPGRGATEGRTSDAPPIRPRLSDYAGLLRNRTFLYNTAGLAAVTFVTGAYAAWGSTFYQRVHGMSTEHAGAWIGGLTVLAGLLGIVLGMWLSDAWLRVNPRAYLLWAGLAVAVATPFGVAAILDPYYHSSLPLLFIAMVLMASVLGPCNTVTANVVPAGQRSAGFALSIFLIHLFGDISSPILIGLISELFGASWMVESRLGLFLAGQGARPVATPNGPANLTVGMLMVVPAMVIGACLFLIGSRYLTADYQRARRESLATEPALSQSS